MSRIFENVLLEMRERKVIYSEPRSFQEYLRANHINSQNTASHISIQKIEDLKPELRKEGYMVFRLGSRPNDNNTYFALAALSNKDDWSEYFLIDKIIFKDTQPEIFLPNVSIRQLFAFNLLSNLTENSLINLAISSGLLANALNIETSESLAASASGQGIFSFEFKPNSQSELIWNHYKGQVEIDALFVGRRNSQETLFVVEAKTSSSFQSLAKHKLVYPVLALRSKVPGYIPMIPVYVRAIKSKSRQEISFYIAECTPLDARKETISINKLDVVSVKHLVLMGFNNDQSF
ncbi:hypothetical protein H6F67_21685 [Microcoleus sp. FACHB-1515]|uniref:DUF6997 domain-containing protein n=1 Tax=Cyanophyceae TaxID=3028117 RepID=UPI0016820E27|nr:hypothetical protein [Microcoleus sp. FACHB-1515]MBD2092463.1 hypothetical protein [Microcoleus sp. FACHB-1515]